MILLILRKGAKSISLSLRDFFKEFCPIDKVLKATAGAFTKARKKLNHTAFIELSKQLVKCYYKVKTYKTWKHFRLISIDGSKIRLPEKDDLKAKFDFVINKKTSEYVSSLASVAYDVLNNICIDSVLAHSKAYEVDLAFSHLKCLNKFDLLILDRNYAAFMALPQNEYFYIFFYIEEH